MRILLFCGLLLTAHEVLAKGAGSNSGYITGIMTTRDNSVEVRFSEPIVNPANCSNSTIGYFLEIPADSPGHRRIYKQITTAFYLHTKVSFWINGGSCSDLHWNKTFPTIFSIRLYP